MPKRIGLLTLGAVVLLALAGAAARAQDPPHWQGENTAIDCTSACHQLHHAQGSQLTQAASNVALCQSCHMPGLLAGDLPIKDTLKASPGIAGIHHAFDVAATADLDGDGIDDVLPPEDAERVRRLPNDNIVCSTCHDQHKSEKIYGGTPRVGNAKMLTGNGSPDGLGTGGVFNGAAGLWYLVEIAQTGDETAARFGFADGTRRCDGDGTTVCAVDTDCGANAPCSDWLPADCDPGAAGPTDPWGTVTGCLTADGANPVSLGADGVTVAFAAGTYANRDRWEFSAGYPYLRWASPPSVAGALLDSGANDTGDKFCRDCHRPWVMETADVRSWTGEKKSHPIGVDMQTTTAYHGGVPLDGDGSTPAGACQDSDGNPSNDLCFDSSTAAGRIQCLTCHGVHFVDSLTETVDQP